jgi:hypothetical protein
VSGCGCGCGSLVISGSEKERESESECRQLSFPPIHSSPSPPLFTLQLQPPIVIAHRSERRIAPSPIYPGRLPWAICIFSRALALTLALPQTAPPLNRDPPIPLQYQLDHLPSILKVTDEGMCVFMCARAAFSPIH